ncbi:MAG: hypothetical protein HAW62_02415 [Endozoicomonadaceae bacterium]|nr:hypothetical protein [Endozoicomonadaceae bacterium]
MTIYFLEISTEKIRSIGEVEELCLQYEDDFSTLERILLDESRYYREMII